MSTTNVILIGDALRLIGVLASIEAIEPEDADIGLRVLNEMMDDWTERQIEVGWSTQTNLAATSPLDDEAVGAVKYMLALSLAPYYAKEPPPSVVANAQRLYLRILRKSIEDQMEEVDMTVVPMSFPAALIDFTKP